MLSFNPTALVMTFMVLDYAGSSAYDRKLVGIWICWVTTLFFTVLMALSLAALIYVGGIVRPWDLEMTGTDMATSAECAVICEAFYIRRIMQLVRK